MKVTDLNELQQAVNQFMQNNTVAIHEVMSWSDVESWFVTVYTQLSAVKEVTLRYRYGWLYDITIITTMHSLTIINNATEAMSWIKVKGDLISYDGLLDDLYNMAVWLNAVYIRLLQRV